MNVKIMSCFLYVTRASVIHQSESNPITREKWEALVSGDATLLMEVTPNLGWPVN